MSGIDRLRLEYIPIEQAALWEKNPKRHDIGAICQSFNRYGFKDPPKFEPELNGGRGGLVEGNGRTTALLMMMQAGDDPPRGILVETGTWAMPILFGVDAASEAVAEAYAIDHNNLTMAGGDFAPWEIAGMWDEVAYAEMLRNLAIGEELLPVSVPPEDLDSLLQGLNVDWDVTDQDVDKAKAKLDEQFGVAQDHVRMICPHCAQRFYLDRSMIDEISSL